MLPDHDQPTDSAPQSKAKAGKPARADFGTLKAIKPAAFGYEQARHLLWRAGFGGTSSQIQTLAAWGPEKSVDHLLTPEVAAEPAEHDQFDAHIMRPLSADERRMAQTARRSQDEETLAKFRLRQQEAEIKDRDQIRAIQRWWLVRMIRTPRPLEEKLTLFWHGHFATSYRTIENSYHMYLQNQLFRRHACGNFGDLLMGIIRDPAMLAYLDNNDSKKAKPNENLARELMELFGLGVGHYSERDIKEGARALTGYTFEDDAFVFRKNDHDTGGKTILGVSGNLDGEGFVSAILGQRACAQFVAAKLYRFLVADFDASDRDAPALRMIDDLGGDLLASRYDLKPMLRRLLLSEHFYHPSVMGQQIKSPVQLVVGAMRSLGTPLRDAAVLLDAMDLMGQDLLFPPSVKGWDGGRSWINTGTLYVRQNILAFLLTGKRPKGYDPLSGQQLYDPAALLEDLKALDASSATDPTRVIEYLQRFTLGKTSESATSSLKNFVTEHGGVIDREILVGLLLLIAAMPEYQLC